jgi:serine/threonine-protein kinase
MVVVLRVTSGPHAGLECAFAGPGSHPVGRALHVPVSLPEDRLLSREHFRIEVRPPLCDLVDLGSTNGTKVNGLRVERVRLGDGDVIQAGETEIAVHVSAVVDDGRAAARCPGCGTAGPDGSADGEEPGHWFCETCDARRAGFPSTDPDYLIERSIGSGGMGEVYLARQLSTNRPVAIKMMTATPSAGGKAREYFHREMTVLKDLLVPGGRCHPNIVAFFDIFEVEGRFQLVMEYVPGKNAMEWAASLGGPVPIAAAARIGRHLLAALDYAHSKGYVHRDVKPTNLLVVGPPQRPKAKLSDFGLAKSFRENPGFVGLTTQGDVGGSVGFISPDHIREFRDLKEPADIYSAGVTIFYLLTGQYPYLNFDPYKGDAYSTILENPPVPLRAHRPDAPESLERVILKALEKQPRDRWKSAAVMAAALRPFLDGPP